MGRSILPWSLQHSIWCLAILALQPGLRGVNSYASVGQTTGLTWNATVTSIATALQEAAVMRQIATWADCEGLFGAGAEDCTSGRKHADATTRMGAMRGCMNKAYPKLQATTWEKAMLDVLPNLRVAASWWSSDATLDRGPLTVLTSSGMDRLHQVSAQCRSWSGPSSIVLWQPLVQQSDSSQLEEGNLVILRDAILAVSQMLVDLASVPESCVPDILLVYELYDEVKTTTLYPINLLRNIARLQARTPLIAHVDADMTISRSLASRMENTRKTRVMTQTAAHNTVYVIPAFESYGPVHEAAAWSDALVTREKDVLRLMVLQKAVDQFDIRRHFKGHAPTDYPRWYSARKDYPVVCKHKYEPWTMGDRIAVPWYDARYRGYSMDRIAHTAHLKYMQYKFLVLHDVFIIHRAHAPSASRKEWYSQSQQRGRIQPASVFGHPAKLFERDAYRMKEGTYKPVISKATLDCLQALPWWAGTGAAGGAQVDMQQPLSTA